MQRRDYLMQFPHNLFLINSSISLFHFMSYFFISFLNSFSILKLYTTFIISVCRLLERGNRN
ncbi:hypothetical protein HNQ62_002388 [Sulfurisphaera ohwakuensis]|uniref:Uncharacterized protein n=1 Tax=Sulfurisphaera ohwakuensis TaxID=69656 RepID=A0A7J9RZE3_SULOH|nr:hypothetical protein [Sulfurisphaera ohwakuensis]